MIEKRNDIRQSLFEDLMDEIELSDIRGDVPEEEPQPERQFDTAHWKYIFHFYLLICRPANDGRDTRQYVTDYANFAAPRFYDFMESFNCRAYSSIHWMNGGKEYRIPEDLDELCRKKKPFSDDSDFLCLSFGMDVDFKNAKQLFRTIANLTAVTKAWAVNIDTETIEESPAVLYNLQMLNMLVFDNTGKHRNHYSFEHPDRMEFFKECAAFAGKMLGKIDRTLAYLKKVTGIDNVNTDTSQIIHRFLDDGPTRKVRIGKKMEESILSNPVDAEFLKGDSFVGYYFTSPVKNRSGKNDFVVLDTKTRRLSEELLDEVDRRKVVVKDFTLRATRRGWCLFCAYIGLYYTPGLITEETGQVENDVYMFFNGSIENEDFWETIASIFHIEKMDDVNKIVKRTFA